MRESAAATWLNKLLSPYDLGYVDLQSPTGAGSAVLVYNYDGYVYPSDEARMLPERGNVKLRLGRIGDPISRLEGSNVVQWLRSQSDGEARSECADCSYHLFCGPDPVEALAADLPQVVAETDHCQRSTWMFRHLLDRLDQAEAEANEEFLDLAYAWARRDHPHRCDDTQPSIAHEVAVSDKSRRRRAKPTSETAFRGIPVRAYASALES